MIFKFAFFLIIILNMTDSFAKAQRKLFIITEDIGKKFPIIMFPRHQR
jgi:hypothetical protein